MSRKTLHWPAVSSRCSSPSRPWKTRSRSCAASRRSTSCTTACASPTRDRGCGDAVEPLHPGPLPAGQGDRPDGRGGEPHPHGGGFKPEEIDELDRRIIQLKIEREALKKETDKPRRIGWPRCARSSPSLEQQSSELTHVGGRTNATRSMPKAGSRKSSTAARIEAGAGAARGRSRQAPASLLYGVIPDLEAKLVGGGADPEAERDAQGRSHRGRHRRRRRALDRHPGRPDAGRRAREAARLWKTTSRTRNRPGGGDRSPSPRPFAVHARGCRTRTGRSAPSCSWARPASARPN